MKIRNGFVSNSSSSSYLILKENTDMNTDNILKHNISKIKEIQNYDFKDEDDRRWLNEIASEIGSRIIIDYIDIPYSSDIDDGHIENILNSVLKSFNIKNKITLKSIGE